MFIERTIRDHIRNYLPPAKDGTITLSAPGTIMQTSPRQWMESVRKAEGRDAFRPYAASLLLVHYQLTSKERRANVATYLAELDAYKDFRQPLPTLNTEDPTTIAKRLQAFWEPRGLNLKFVE